MARPNLLTLIETGKLPDDKLNRVRAYVQRLEHCYGMLEDFQGYDGGYVSYWERETALCRSKIEAMLK